MDHRTQIVAMGLPDIDQLLCSFVLLGVGDLRVTFDEVFPRKPSECSAPSGRGSLDDLHCACRGRVEHRGRTALAIAITATAEWSTGGRTALATAE